MIYGIKSRREVEQAEALYTSGLTEMRAAESTGKVKFYIAPVKPAPEGDGVFSGASIGSKALHCCQRYGARANNISINNSGLINSYVPCRYSDKLISRASALLELIFIRGHSFNLSG